MEEAKILGMLKLNPIAIKNIENPTDEMKIMALKRDGLLLRYLTDSTREMEQKNRRSNRFIRKNSEISKHK